MPKKTFNGTVVSDKMQKTVVVAVSVRKAHPVYRKVVPFTRKFKAHDDLGAKVGDSVKIEESRPYSKEVTWKVVEILKE